MPAPDFDRAAEPPGAPGPLAAPVARAVADDLESIFPDQPPARGRPGRRLRLLRGARPAAEPGRRSRERRAASLGALMAAACVGVTAGALFAHGKSPSRPAPLAESPGVPIAMVSAPLPPPGPLPSQAAGYAPPVLPAPIEATSEAPAAPPPMPSSELGSAPISDAAAPAVAAPAHRRKPAHVKPARASGSLAAADARLRHAYAAAERAGVAHAVLADYRQEWGRLRHRAAHQPGMVATRYRQMAGELNRMAAHQRVARAEPPRVGPWRRFRMQLAALWR